MLIVAIAALLATSALWNVPFSFSAAASIVLLAVAAFTWRERAPTPSATAGATGMAASPDVSMQATLEAFPQAGFLLDPDGIVRYANSHAAELFPATRPGDPFTFTFRWPEIGAALEQARSGQAHQVEFHEPGERSRIYSISLSPIRYAARSSRFVLVTFDDVSDRLAVARMRADFVANASHELRTPLASLTGFIETLLGPARDDPHATEKFLGIMLEQARRMRRLIDDLLSLSRAEMRAHRRPTERVDLRGVLDHVLTALGPMAENHDVRLEGALPDPPVEVIGDRDELVQVFQNLIENAIRYGGSGKRVHVSVEFRHGAGGAVAVHVQDYGPGIAPEHLPRLTERFYRVDPGTSRHMQGTGLGLAIVKHILSRHGGELEIKSRPGEGARFTAELPPP